MVDGGGLETHPDRCSQDGYISPTRSRLKSPESGQNSRDPTAFGAHPDNRSPLKPGKSVPRVPFRPVLTRSLHWRLHMQALRRAGRSGPSSPVSKRDAPLTIRHYGDASVPTTSTAAGVERCWTRNPRVARARKPDLRHGPLGRWFRSVAGTRGSAGTWRDACEPLVGAPAARQAAPQSRRASTRRDRSSSRTAPAFPF